MNMTTKDRVDTEKIFLEAIKKKKVSEERKDLLKNIAKSIVAQLQNGTRVNLNFICTHNSRRSQFSQVWAHYAIHYFGLANLASFSSGTEITAFHKNTLTALEAFGFRFSLEEFSHTNPVYDISFEGNKKPLKGFSKLVDSATNDKPFIAITTCDSADENCPYIPEALQRIHLPFVDPKHADDTEEQEETYFNTSKQIAGEIGYIFKKVAKKLAS